MSDNYTTNPGSGGKTFASDQISGIDYPRIKLVHGVDGESSGDVAGSNPLPTSTVVDPQNSHSSDSGIAAGGQATLNSSQISSGKTGHLLMVLVASSVPWKAELRTVSDGVASNVIATWFSMNPTPVFLRNMITVSQSAVAGLDGFRVLVTNLSPNSNDSADIYASFFWDEL